MHNGRIRDRIKRRVSAFCAQPNLYPVGLLMAITVFLFADQNLMAPNLSLIANEFGFNEIERDQKLAGDISLAFFLIGGGASVFVGCFIDKVHRIRLYASMVCLGELSCVLTYWCANYEQLFWLRALTGVAIGGAMPILFALLGDFFPTGQRARSASLAGTAMAIGIGVGQLAAGFMQSCCGWRTPFLAVGSPSIVLSIVLVFTVSEPVRGAQERTPQTLSSQSEDEEPVDGEEAAFPTPRDEDFVDGEETAAFPKPKNYFAALKEAARTPSILLIGLQGLPGSVPWGILLAFFNDYLIADMHLSAEAASFVIIIFGMGSLGGLLGGGFLGDRLLIRKGPPWVGYLMSITTIIGAVMFYLLININWSSPVFYTLLSLPTGFFASVTGANVKSMLIEVSSPRTRGAVFACFNLMDDLGKGLGPFIIAAIISATGSRRSGFNYSLLGWVFSSTIHFALSFTLTKDRARILGLHAPAASSDSDSSSKASISFARLSPTASP